jgi:hypothetical protein
MDQTSNDWNDKRPEDLIHQAEQLLNNAQTHPEMTRPMAAYGYDQERWDYGRSPVETAKNVFLKCHSERRIPLMVVCNIIWRVKRYLCWNLGLMPSSLPQFVAS